MDFRKPSWEMYYSAHSTVYDVLVLSLNDQKERNVQLSHILHDSMMILLVLHLFWGCLRNQSSNLFHIFILALLSILLTIWALNVNTNDVDGWMYSLPNSSTTVIPCFLEGIDKLWDMCSRVAGSGGGICESVKKALELLNISTTFCIDIHKHCLQFPMPSNQNKSHICVKIMTSWSFHFSSIKSSCFCKSLGTTIMW